MPPPRRRSGLATCGLIAGIVALVLVVGLVVLLAIASQLPDPPPEPGLGQEVTSSDVSFTLTQYDCGVELTDLATGPIEPVGQWCSLEMTIVNNSDKSIVVDNRLVELEGDVLPWAADETIPMADSIFEHSELAPGETAKGFAYYDVPPDELPEKALVKAPGGDKVTVKLT